MLAATERVHAIIEPMLANDRMPCVWSRRSLLVVLAAGSVAVLSGCRVQLEEGAPHIPLVPTRVPMKDEKALLALLRRTTTLGSLARAVGGAPMSVAGQLIAIHSTQVEVIARLMRDGGVPETTIGANRTAPATAAPTATAPRTTASHTTASPTRQPLAPLAMLSAAERDSVSEVSLGDLSNAHVALIGSMMAQRIAAVTLLGGTAAPVVPAGLIRPEAVRLLEAARAAVYGFEIVAAQIDRTGRALAASTLASLRTRASELHAMVGSTGTPAPLGYELPFPVNDGASARRLALHLLQALLTRQASALGPATGEATSLATLVQWLGATDAIASRWGSPLTAFPGLTNA